jgi:hypothetical protein
MSRKHHISRSGVDPCIAYVCVVVVLLLSAAAHIAGAQSRRGRFPGSLEAYLTSTVKLSARERQQLISGAPMTKMLDADASKEVAVFGAVWINAPIHRYVEAVKDIEAFERDGG